MKMPKLICLIQHTAKSINRTFDLALADYNSNSFTEAAFRLQLKLH